MDSQNPQDHEHPSQTVIRQDAPSIAATSLVRRTPPLAETIASYHPPQLAPSIPANQQAHTSGHQAMTFPPITGSSPALAEAPDDQPVTVPVLGSQPATKQWEQVLNDIESIWPGDRNSEVDENDEDDEEPELDAAGNLTGRAYLREDAFAFRERSWEGLARVRRRALILTALAVMLALAVVGAAAAVSYARRATQHLTVTSPTPTVSSYSGGVVVQPGPDTIAPTPAAPKYQIGAWMSNNAPTGGTVKVFVRLSHNVAPIAHVSVTLLVQIPSGALNYTTKTDSYGLATFTVRYGGVTGEPVFVTASATVGGQAITADTVFVPI